MSRAAYLRALHHAAKRNASVPALLAQPALLTDRIQPIRRPILRLRKP